MTRLTDYTTEELERLTTLSELTAKPVVSNEQHGGRRVISRISAKEGRLLDVSSARRFQTGWEADGFSSTYVWALLDDGHVTGNPGAEWKLLD